MAGFKRNLEQDLREHRTDYAGGNDGNSARDNERVVDDEFADVCRTSSVEADAGQVGRIRRQNEVAVGRAKQSRRR